MIARQTDCKVNLRQRKVSTDKDKEKGEQKVRGGPGVFEQIEADFARLVQNIWVEHLRYESHGGRAKGIRVGHSDLNLKVPKRKKA